MFTSETKDATVTVTGFDGEVNFLNIPQEIDGLPVTAVSARAFSDRKDLREVRLHETVTTLHAFAFHNCTSLRRITLHNSVTDYYDGVIKGCSAIEEVCILADLPEDQSSFEAIKRMLGDTDIILKFRIVYPDGEALLTFPDYLNEAREDTRARAIHYTIEGAGYAYRECVRRKQIDYAGYDALFDRVRSTAHVTAEEIAMNRLMAPYGLYDTARASYETFLEERTVPLLNRLIAEGDRDRIGFLAENHLIDASELDLPIETASHLSQADIVARLMNYH